MNKRTLNVDDNGVFITVDMACKKTNFSRYTIMKIANEAGAIIRVGRSVRVDWDKLHKYMSVVYMNP